MASVSLTDFALARQGETLRVQKKAGTKLGPGRIGFKVEPRIYWPPPLKIAIAALTPAPRAFMTPS